MAVQHIASLDYRDFVTGEHQRQVAGVDEAGRGPLAGSVWAAAVILDPQQPVIGLMDSKKLSPSKRSSLAAMIKQQAASYALAEVTAAEIDRLNILQASLLAMRRAIQGLSFCPKMAWIDGLHPPDQGLVTYIALNARVTDKKTSVPCYPLVKGDAKMPAISAASILAKVARDAQMLEFAEQFTGYGFEKHKGYPTAQHLRALQQLGPCAIHRRSYAPVRRCLEGMR